MREKSIAMFDDNVFLSGAMSALIQAKNIKVVKFIDFSQLMMLLPESHPSILMMSDHNSLGVTKAQIDKIKNHHPDIHVVLCTYNLLSEKEGKELRRYSEVSIVSLKHPLSTLDTVLDMLIAGYHIYDSNCIENQIHSDMMKEKTLSPMETTVLTMMTRGVSVRDMSKTLNIAEKTVMTYKRRFLCKLGAHSLRDCLIP